MCKISAILAHKVASERVDALKCSAVWCAFSLKQSLQYDTMMYIFPKAKQCNPRLPSVRLGAARRCTYFLDYCPTIDKLSSLLYSLIFSSSTSSLIEDTSNIRYFFLHQWTCKKRAGTWFVPQAPRHLCLMSKDTIEHFKTVGFRSFSGISAFIHQALEVAKEKLQKKWPRLLKNFKNI